ncbi:hypothetical protein KUTeg_004054, partial [Tegillarca granosa]
MHRRHFSNEDDKMMLQEEIIEDGDGDEESWYQNDLHLAAELGKALLERNRELESQLMQYQQNNYEQTLEIQFLTKQLESIRANTDSRMRVYEELDKSVQELEKTNQRLIEEMDKAEEKRKQLKQKQESRRAISLANLTENSDYLKNLCISDLHWTYTEKFKNLPLNPYEIEIKNLQDTIKQLKAQQLIERRKKEDLETEVSLLWEENESLDKKLKDYDQALKRNQGLEEELQQIKVEKGRYCDICGNDIDKIVNNLDGEVEHDDPKLSTEGKVVRLGGGGSVYGSTESVNKIAPDTRDLSPEDPETSGMSILNELETQYQNLFQKYEKLLQGKGKRPGSFSESGETFDEALHRHLAHKEVQTLLKLQKTDACTGGDNVGEEAGSPPPYKSIFRDIFATLKKSRIEESGELATSANSTPATSPMAPEQRAVAPKFKLLDQLHLLRFDRKQFPRVGKFDHMRLVCDRLHAVYFGQ